MRRHGVFVAVTLGVAMLGAYLLLWIGVVSPLRARGSDFSASYVAGQVLRAGQGSLLYDQNVERVAHVAILPPGARFDLPFLTPPSTAALAVPLTFLDPETADRLFSLVQFGLVLAAALIAARAAPWGASCRPGMRLAATVVGAAGAGTAVMLLLGQWDGVNAIGLALAYSAWRKDRGRTAALWLALTALIAKPHLALGVAAFLVGRRQRSELGVAASVTAAMALVWTAITGFAGVGAFLSGLATTLDHTPASSTVGLTGLFSSWFGNGHAVESVGLGFGIVALLACALLGHRSRRGDMETTLGGAVALSLVASPHLLAHDLSLLAPVFVWMLASATARDYGRAPEAPWPGRNAATTLGAWVVFNALVVVDAGASDVGAPGRLVPWALLLCGVVALATSPTRGASPREGSVPQQAGAG